MLRGDQVVRKLLTRIHARNIYVARLLTMVRYGFELSLASSISLEQFDPAYDVVDSA